MMRNILIALSALAILFNSCKKEDTSRSYASLNVVNAAIETGTIKVNYFNKSISWSALTGSIGAVKYGENQVITIFQLHNDYSLNIVSGLDTLTSIFNQKLSMEPNGMYTMFATGQLPNFDVVFVKEINIAYNFVDSAIAVRFVNLSPNSPKVNITLASTPTINEIAELGYKQITDFKNYAVLKVIPSGSVTFQVRDAGNNSVLTSYTIPVAAISPYVKVSTSLSRFKSITLAIKGISGVVTGTNAYSVFPIAQY